MEFFIALICNLVALAIGAAAYLIFGASGAISGNRKSSATGITIGLVILVISAIVSYSVLGAVGIGATLLAIGLIAAFIIFKPLRWFRRK